MNTPPVMPLKLEESYYEKGFFNVKVEYDQYVRQDNGYIALALRGNPNPVRGRVDRKANQNGTARVYGNKPLRDWFREQYSPLDTVSVHFDTPYQLTLR